MTIKTKKSTCQIQSERVCKDEIVRRYKGRKKTDPEFNACLACFFELQRMGVRGIKAI